jgi:hypothetical protein
MRNFGQVPGSFRYSRLITSRVQDRALTCRLQLYPYSHNYTLAQYQALLHQPALIVRSLAVHAFLHASTRHHRIGLPDGTAIAPTPTPPGAWKQRRVACDYRAGALVYQADGIHQRAQAPGKERWMRL